MFVDNNVLSKAFRGDIAINARSISSVAAGEFLSIYKGSQPTKANYYIPYFNGLHGKIFERGGLLPSLESPKGHPFTKKKTDQIILDFGNDYPKLIEYGSLALTKVINEKLYSLYIQAIQHLPKDNQKILKRSISFLLDNEYRCYPLKESIVYKALELLDKFVLLYGLKGNFRNSINDLLILSTSIEYNEQLQTYDGLLQRFAAQVYSATISQEQDILTIDFGKDIAFEKNIGNKESKGYINRGWQVSFKKGNF